MACILAYLGSGSRLLLLWNQIGLKPLCNKREQLLFQEYRMGLGLACRARVLRPTALWWNTNSCTTRPPTRCSVMMRSMWPGVTL